MAVPLSKEPPRPEAKIQLLGCLLVGEVPEGEWALGSQEPRA